MQLELNLEDARVLNLAVEHIINDKHLAEKIYAGFEEDIKKLKGIGGRLRAQYTLEKSKT